MSLMKRRVLLLVLIGTMVPSTAWGQWSTEKRFKMEAPTLEGSSGLFRSIAATAGYQWDLRVGMHFEYFQHNEFIVANWDGCAASESCPNEQNRRFQGAVTFGFTPWKYLEVFGALFSTSNINVREHLTPTQEPAVQMALGDWLLGVKGFYPLLKGGLSLGGNFGVKFLNAYGDIATNAKATNVFFNFLMTLDVRPFTKGKVPLRFHLNLGFIYDPSHIVLGDTPNDYTPKAGEPSSEPRHAFLVQQFALGLNYSRFRIGIGIEAPLPYLGGLINPIVDIQLDIATGQPNKYIAGSETEGIDPWPEFAGKDYNIEGRVSSRIAIGIRWRPIAGLFIDTGVDIAMSHQGFAMGPPLPPWNIFFQVGYMFSTKATTKIKRIVKVEIREVPKFIKPKPTEGKIRGVVKDSKTGVPVATAIITFPGLGLTDLATAEDGSYTTYKLKGGQVKIEVRHPQYKTWTGVGMVLVNKVITLNIPLVTAAPKTGTVIGTCSDKGGTPLAAQIVIEGTENKKLTADSGGTFTVKLKPGAYKIKAVMDGYFNRYNAFVVEAGTKQSLSFKLTKRPKRAIVIVRRTYLRIRKKIHFAYNRAKIRPDSLQILEAVAAVLQENPEIVKLRIEGHTDRRGGYRRNLRLSQRRAEAVRDYLIAQGVEASHLIAKGYGYKRPRVPELTPRHRAINRRVEFKILKRSKPYRPRRRRRRRR